MEDVAGFYLPRKTPDAEPYWEGALRHELRYQTCNGCRATVFHPRSVCPYCLSEDLRWEVSQGKGRIYSFTVLHRAPNPAYAAKLPYALGIVEVEEGFHMFTEIVNCDLGSLAIGQPVRVVFDEVAPGVVLPKFEPAASAEQALQ